MSAKKGEFVLEEPAREKIAAIRSIHSRSGVILLALGLLVGVAVPFFWSSADDLGKGAMVAGVFVLASVGGWCLGMATFGWVLSKARWGAEYFPTVE